MFVFVAGSGRHLENGKGLFADFKQACENIGMWLYREHTLLVAGTVEPYADHYVLNGAIRHFGDPKPEDQKKIQNVKIFSAKDDETQTKKDNKVLELVKQYKVDIYYSEHSNWQIAHRRAMEKADLLVIIGGGDDTKGIVELANDLQKPTISFANYGAVGAKIYSKMEMLYENWKLEDKYTTFIKCSSLIEEDSEELFLETVKEVIRIAPTDKRKPLGVIALSVLSLAFLLILVYLWNETDWELFIKLTSVSIVSGLLGSLARMCTLWFIQYHERASIYNFFREIFRGFSLAISVIIIALSIIKFMFGSLELKPDNIQNISLIVTVITFYYVFLTKRLDSIIDIISKYLPKR